MVKSSVSKVSKNKAAPIIDIEEQPEIEESKNVDMLSMIKSVLKLLEKEHTNVGQLKKEINKSKESYKNSILSQKKDLSSEKTVSKNLEKSVKKINSKFDKVESELNAGISKINNLCKSITPIIAKYDKNSEKQLNAHFKKFEVYSKSIEDDIEANQNENHKLLDSALDTINNFIKEQENLKALDDEKNTKDHRHMKADINIMKEEFITITDEYGRIEKDINEIRTSELKKEETHIVKIITDLKKDIKNIDKAIDSEKLNIKRVVADIIDAQKRYVRTNMEISKKYVDTNLKHLCEKIEDLSSKNRQLINIIEQKEKTYDAEKKNTIDTQAKKIDDFISGLDNFRAENDRQITNTLSQALDELKNRQDEIYKEKLHEFTELLTLFSQRDDEREKRVSNILKRMERALTILEVKAQTPGILEKNVRDELDEMISELKQMQSS